MPVSRVELYLAKITGEDFPLPVPFSRVDMYLEKWANMKRAPPGV